MKIRELKIDDIQYIYQLNKEEMGYDYSYENTYQKCQNILKSAHDKIYVAVVNGHVVGYVHANDYDVIYMDHLKNIMGIAVDSHYKRQGIGTRLLQEIEKWAKETGAKEVRLVSGESRKAAHEFYKQCGYNSSKKQLNFIKFFS